MKGFPVWVSKYNVMFPVLLLYCIILMCHRVQPVYSRGETAPSLQKAKGVRYRHRWRHSMVRCPA